ncbi:MAG TPA: sterol desaturase family protein [Caulobacteraceae bacterium]|jgi:sterol desaturase/sphingolipid hydroxylase (fatty acid hydroxylase superfamily)
MFNALSHILSKFHNANASVAGLGILVFLAGCAGRYLFLCHQTRERPTFGGLFNFTFPLKRLITASTRIDLVFYVVNKLSHHLLIITNVALAVLVSRLIGDALRAHIGGGGLALSLPIIALAYALAFLPRDLMHYVVHYLHHKVPALWEFHKVHHAATYLTPLTTERTHPVEDQIFAVAEGLAMGAALGLLRWRYAFSDSDILVIIPTAIWSARMLLLTPLQHSHVPLHFGVLDPVFYSPSLHQVHHSCELHHRDRNFGECLSAWDSLFGTYHRMGQDTVTLGLPKDEPLRFTSLFACCLRPFGSAFFAIFGTSTRRTSAQSTEDTAPSPQPERSMNLGSTSGQS